MRTITYYVGTTLDGYIAGPDGSVDFFAPDEETFAYIAREFPDTLPTHARPALGLGPGATRFDTVVMGRATYEPALEVGITDPYAHLRTYVVSSTLPAADDPNVTIVGRDPLDVVRDLKAQDGGDIWLAGGGRLAGAVLSEIDELVLKLYPVVAGTGIGLFGEAPFAVTGWTASDTDVLTNGTIVARYRR